MDLVETASKLPFFDRDQKLNQKMEARNVHAEGPECPAFFGTPPCRKESPGRRVGVSGRSF